MGAISTVEWEALYTRSSASCPLKYRELWLPVAACDPIVNSPSVLVDVPPGDGCAISASPSWVSRMWSECTCTPFTRMVWKPALLSSRYVVNL